MRIAGRLHRRRLLRLAGALAAALMLPTIRAVPVRAQQPVQWHGYAQLRYARTDPGTGFSIRRGKLWVEGTAPGLPALAFKAQGVFRNAASGALVLQDLFAEYRLSAVALRVGQFVPDFSLQRAQPDYQLPLVERAAVVETMIPGARTLGRDIGAQVVLAPPSTPVRLTAGIFNGAGANRSAGEDGDFLATSRLVMATSVGAGMKGAVGGSFAWRETEGADVGALSTSAGGFAGRDIRWGVEARLVADDWEVQGEYLHADLSGEASQGFYGLGVVALTPLDELIVSVERLETPGATVPGGPWYIVGYTRLLADAQHLESPREPAKGGAYPTRIMTDLRVRFDHGRPRTGAAVQLQVFLH